MENGILLQYFHYYIAKETNLWAQLYENTAHLQDIGVTAIWAPPAFKGASGDNSVGYDVYDLYDLGEFDQKGSVITKYGTKDQYLKAIEQLQKHGMHFYADVVLNHKMGGDEKELVKVIKVDPNNREKIVSEPFEAEAYTVFKFENRGDKYSNFKWDNQCFTGIDYVEGQQSSGIYKILNQYGNNWEQGVDGEHGNYDYLMGCDIEFRNPAVLEEIKNWIQWYADTTHFDGLRLDALKHIPIEFIKSFVSFVQASINSNIFVVGEYWSPDLETLTQYAQNVGENIHLFDVPLQKKFHEASKAGNQYDLSKIFEDTLVVTLPNQTVTFVANHDTQPLQSLESPVEPWFKPIAYALILLRKTGYPCVFYADLYGAHYTDHGNDGNDHEIDLPVIDLLPEIMKARKDYAYGDEQDYFDHPNCIAWVRDGDEQHKGCVVVLSNGDEGIKEITLTENLANTSFIDILSKDKNTITIDENGKGLFTCPAGSLSIWVLEN